MIFQAIQPLLASTPHEGSIATCDPWWCFFAISGPSGPENSTLLLLAGIGLLAFGRFLAFAFDGHKNNPLSWTAYVLGIVVLALYIYFAFLVHPFITVLMVILLLIIAAVIFVVVRDRHRQAMEEQQLENDGRPRRF
jgi:uncharacterized membrane protein